MLKKRYLHCKRSRSHIVVQDLSNPVVFRKQISKLFDVFHNTPVALKYALHNGHCICSAFYFKKMVVQPEFLSCNQLKKV